MTILKQGSIFRFDGKRWHECWMILNFEIAYLQFALYKTNHARKEIERKFNFTNNGGEVRFGSTCVNIAGFPQTSNDFRIHPHSYMAMKVEHVVKKKTGFKTLWLSFLSTEDMFDFIKTVSVSLTFLKVQPPMPLCEDQENALNHYKPTMFNISNDWDQFYNNPSNLNENIGMKAQSVDALQAAIRAEKDKNNGRKRSNSEGVLQHQLVNAAPDYASDSEQESECNSEYDYKKYPKMTTKSYDTKSPKLMRRAKEIDEERSLTIDIPNKHHHTYNKSSPKQTYRYEKHVNKTPKENEHIPSSPIQTKTYTSSPIKNYSSTMNYSPSPIKNYSPTMNYSSSPPTKNYPAPPIPTQQIVYKNTIHHEMDPQIQDNYDYYEDGSIEKGEIITYPTKEHRKNSLDEIESLYSDKSDDMPPRIISVIYSNETHRRHSPVLYDTNSYIYKRVGKDPKHSNQSTVERTNSTRKKITPIHIYKVPIKITPRYSPIPMNEAPYPQQQHTIVHNKPDISNVKTSYPPIIPSETRPISPVLHVYKPAVQLHTTMSPAVQLSPVQNITSSHPNLSIHSTHSTHSPQFNDMENKFTRMKSEANSDIITRRKSSIHSIEIEDKNGIQEIITQKITMEESKFLS
uniref:IRS-type PTB domain-containing protein n=1 Tax=Rhabditophanes sp. KR3021 TaxID=114890 RepID=A0AC35TWP5_9BILA